MKSVLLLLATAVFVEILLQAACLISPPVDAIIFGEPPIRIVDEQLRYKGNPDFFDHDSNGYRNESRYNPSDIVALGDSHTYGTSVSVSEAWPYLLQNETGLKAYNMGFVGYGQAHSFLQLNEAIDLSPKLVIVGVYFGNDFFDNFVLALKNKKIASVLSAEELKIIETLEEKSKLENEVIRLFHLSIHGKVVDKEEAGGGNLDSLRSFLSDNSSLYGLTRAVKGAVKEVMSTQTTVVEGDFDTAISRLTDEQLKYCSVYEETNGWRTVFTSSYRGVVNDRSDPRIAVGFELTKRLMAKIHAQVVETGAELLIVLIPTKESVFADKVVDKDAHIGFSALIRDERSNRQELKKYLEEEKVPYIDLLPYLQDTEKQPYFGNADGHPNALGHEIIAEAIVGWMSSNEDALGNASFPAR